MPRGRRSQPDAVKAIKGNPGKRAMAKESKAAAGEAIATAIGKILPPKNLSADALKHWNELAPELERLNFLRETDRTAFARYCQTLAQFWEATKQLKKGDVVYWTESQHGKLQRINPYFIVQDRLDKRLLALEDRFGLSPAARQQVIKAFAGLPGQLPFGNADKPAQPETPAQPESGADGAIGFLN